jgi:hypothetical protein
MKKKRSVSELKELRQKDLEERANIENDFVK